MQTNKGLPATTIPIYLILLYLHFLNTLHMEIAHGWKPLPVLLKIIWIFTLLGAFFAIFLIFSVYGKGFELFGIPIYGIIAVNLEFFLDMALPVLLLVAMIMRYRWTWILGTVYFIFFAVNALFGLSGLEEKLAAAMAEMPEMPVVPGMDPADFNEIMYWSSFAGLILGSVIDAAIALAFILKRKYFIAPVPLQPPAAPENK
jgi:hypothetical protein